MKKSLSFFVLGVWIFVAAMPAITYAAIDLVKSKEFGTVYYIDGHGVRHPFPNETTYRSWYGNDFSKIVIVDADFLAQYPLGANITIRPGTFLVKVRTAPSVYVVEPGGVLREIKDEVVAAGIYGKDWAKRVVDVPDVFFQNYRVGAPIVHDYTIPDGVLYQDSATKKYFYKNNGMLEKFASIDAVRANRLDSAQAIVGNRSYYVRDRAIDKLSRNIFNPIAAPLSDRRDCENKKLKAAVILVSKDQFSSDELARVQLIKTAVSARYDWATDGLSSIDFDYPTSAMIDDGYLTKVKNDGTTEVNNEVINSFYDNNEDIFDFIFVWTNFKVPEENGNEIAHFIPVTNRLEGLNRPLMDRGQVYGSTGKLKGIIMMGNINKYRPETVAGLNEALNVVMHEILHQWGAYTEFITTDGKKSKELLRGDDFSHWSYYAGFISPLGGSGWIDNGDGTFTSGLSKMDDTNLRKFSSLDLYLMGLIPYQLMLPVSYVKPKDQGALGNVIAGTLQTIPIEQLISANGEIKCSIN